MLRYVKSFIPQLMEKWFRFKQYLYEWQNLCTYIIVVIIFFSAVFFPFALEVLTFSRVLVKISLTTLPCKWLLWLKFVTSNILFLPLLVVLCDFCDSVRISPENMLTNENCWIIIDILLQLNFFQNQKNTKCTKTTLIWKLSGLFSLLAFF